MEITEKDYQLVESNDVEFYGVKLTTGKWKNVTSVSYTHLTLPTTPYV